MRTRHRFAGPARFLAMLGAVVFIVSVASQLRADATWLLVDTAAMELSVMEGDSVRQRFADISIGRGGAAADKVSGDGRTPLGEYHVVEISRDTPFHLFVRLDYPTPSHARRALATGIITQHQFDVIERTARKRMLPPQRTPLGGYIGIHGVGEGSMEIHESFNWTSGCVALTNEQMDALFPWLRTGMRVVVR